MKTINKLMDSMKDRIQLCRKFKGRSISNSMNFKIFRKLSKEKAKEFIEFHFVE